MADAINSFLKDVAGAFFGNDYLRDYTHASKIFRTNLYGNAPKFKFLFHVYFNINTSFLTLRDNGGAQVRDQNFGLLVKTVKLPSYTFQTQDYNQYNRKRVVQTKIKYDTVDITFHDDNDNMINNLWYRYYTYYYGDGNASAAFFNGKRGARPGPQTLSSTTPYSPNQTAYSWGYIGENRDFNNSTQSKEPFFNNITIFGLNRHNWISYTLINPIITKFNHDTYSYEDTQSTMQHTMTLDYETVLYNQGAQDGENPSNIIPGFGDEPNYDKRLSPIATPGSNSNILGKFGLIDSAGGAVNNLTNENVLKGIQQAGAVYNGFKNINLKQSLQAEITTQIRNALQRTDNSQRNKLFNIPIYTPTQDSDF